MAASSGNILYGKVQPVGTNILAVELEFGTQIRNGIIIPDDNMTDRGIKPRWCKIYKIGPEVEEIEVGDWCLLDHGRWSYGFWINEGKEDLLVRWIDYKDILIVTKDKPDSFATV